MTQIQFYQLTSTPLERAAPKLLEKALDAKYRVALVAESQEKVEFLDQAFWTFAQNAFLPHGTKASPYPEEEPIFLSTSADAPNRPDLLFVADGRTAEKASDYRRVLDMFDGHDPAAVEAARGRWKAYKAAGHDVSYFCQKPDGGWEKKAG